MAGASEVGDFRASSLGTLVERVARRIGLAWRRSTARRDEFRLLGELVRRAGGGRLSAHA